MNTAANNIKQRLSLREPLCKALDVVVRLTDNLSLKKPAEGGEEAFIKEELAKAQGCVRCVGILKGIFHRSHSQLPQASGRQG